eukprot:scaffold2855_cov372-Prasinococcus_capsulatus_cf.AAC.3
MAARSAQREPRVHPASSRVRQVELAGKGRHLSAAASAVNENAVSTTLSAHPGARRPHPQAGGG